MLDSQLTPPKLISWLKAFFYFCLLYFCKRFHTRVEPFKRNKTFQILQNKIIRSIDTSCGVCTFCEAKYIKYGKNYKQNNIFIMFLENIYRTLGVGILKQLFNFNAFCIAGNNYHRIRFIFIQNWFHIITIVRFQKSRPSILSFRSSL